jgi:hypothetical protein
MPIVALHKKGHYPKQPDLDRGHRSLTHAYVDPDDPTETIHFVDVPEPDDDPLVFYRTINHETLHIAMQRIGMIPASRQFDRLVKLRAKRPYGEAEHFMMLLGF